MNSYQALEFLELNSSQSRRIAKWKTESSQFHRDLKWKTLLEFQRLSFRKEWVYLVIFSDEIFAWGKSSKLAKRLRASSLFHKNLQGKYDRRVDYLMLKIIYGEPCVWAFVPKGNRRAIDLERELRERHGDQYHCFGGFEGMNREDISNAIFAEFKKTDHWQNLDDAVQNGFQQYLDEVYFNVELTVYRGNTFKCGDSLEPNYLRNRGKGHLEPAIEKVLLVKFE